jgi:methionyl-tRNA formyltransferase
LRVVYMGTPEFSVAPLEHLFLNGYRVAAVYTRPDREAGRGRSLVFSPVKKAALEMGLEVRQPERLRNPETVAGLAELKPDVIVVAAFGQILPQVVLDIAPFGCINIHPSLLPRYRGASPVAAAILAGDEFTGVSVMKMDAGMDTGPVLLQAKVPVSALDTTGSLTRKLSLVSAHLLQEVLPAWTRGEITPRPQDGSKATYCGTINKGDGEIDWRLPAAEIWRRVRAFQPWPGCYTLWQGKQLKVIEAVPLPPDGNNEAGRVVALQKGEAGFGVAAGEGMLGVVKVQMEGKKAMPAGEFIRGQQKLVGAVLPS